MALTASASILNQGCTSAWQFLISFEIFLQFFILFSRFFLSPNISQVAFGVAIMSPGTLSAIGTTCFFEDKFHFTVKVGNPYRKGDVALEFLNSSSFVTLHTFSGRIPGCDEELAFSFCLCHCHDLAERKNIQAFSGTNVVRDASYTVCAFCVCRD